MLKCGVACDGARAASCVRVRPTRVRILRLRANGAVNCKDIHHEYGVRLPCARCSTGRVADGAVRAEVRADVWERARLRPRLFEACFGDGATPKDTK